MIIDFETGVPSQSETQSVRRERIARERLMIEEGLRHIREGRFVEGSELEAMLEAFENGEPIPERAPRFK